jgi:hypothetical protein
VSGGFFNYRQHDISDLEGQIERLIDSNNDTSKNKYGDQIGREYSAETIAEFKKAVAILAEAYIYVNRIDWLVSGDDGADSFHRRLGEELAGLKNDNT